MPEARSLAQALLGVRERLAGGLGLDPAVAMIEARALAAASLGLTARELFAGEHSPPPPGAEDKLLRLVSRRLAHEPIAYITGKREFYGVDLLVTKSTLVPRPETELLVDKVLQMSARDAAISVADLGTGCGAVAAAVALNRRNSRIAACDIDPAAVALARENAARLEFGNISFHVSDWMAALPQGETFDFILANPPYLTRDEVRARRGDLAHEPEIALDGGRDGLREMRRLIPAAAERLSAGGWLLVEHGFGQGAAVAGIFAGANLAQVETCEDLAGLPRVTLGRRPPAG